MIIYQQLDWLGQTYYFCLLRKTNDSNLFEEQYWTGNHTKTASSVTFEKTSSQYKEVLRL